MTKRVDHPWVQVDFCQFCGHVNSFYDYDFWFLGYEMRSDHVFSWRPCQHCGHVDWEKDVVARRVHIKEYNPRWYAPWTWVCRRVTRFWEFKDGMTRLPKIAGPRHEQGDML